MMVVFPINLTVSDIFKEGTVDDFLSPIWIRPRPDQKDRSF